jgi:dienelactone hydrolase
MKIGMAVVLLLGCACALAEESGVKTETMPYKTGDVAMNGYLAYPANLTARNPGVLVVPEWWGLNDYAKRRARELAALGYVALAADMYGGGKVAKDMKEAGALAGALKSGDRAEMRRRAAAALAALRGFQHTDPARLAAIGYCFGGTTVLELARSGADLRGVVTFHAGLDTPNHEDARNIKAAVLICHGADDPYATKQDIDAVQDDLRKAGVDWQMAFYGGAVHSFTNPDSGNNAASGVAYNAKADRRSWDLMQSFFREIFGEVAR